MRHLPRPKEAEEGPAEPRTGYTSIQIRERGKRKEPGAMGRRPIVFSAGLGGIHPKARASQEPPTRVVKPSPDAETLIARASRRHATKG